MVHAGMSVKASSVREGATTFGDALGALSLQLDNLAQVITDGFTRLEEGLDRVDAGLTRVEDSLDRVEGGLTRVEHRLDRLESLVVHRTSLQFQMAREWNDRAVNTDCELMRLPHPDTGELPPLDSFPATRGHLMTLRVDALLTFYDLRPEENISLHERRDLLGRILGCR